MSADEDEKTPAQPHVPMAIEGFPHINGMTIQVDRRIERRSNHPSSLAASTSVLALSASDAERSFGRE
ncbi:MAG: hypothetical protein GXP15_17875 [Gammaproteobacteria bacterium]|nr:hypothetical protein [Gammaproteobacteria bacterium]